MLKINRFVINSTDACLTLQFDNAKRDNSNTSLSFEYLRVFSPTDEKGNPVETTPKVYHKKQVQLLTIESVGKHGYRFIFDDNHSNIYSAEYIQVLVAEQRQRWQLYLASTDQTINNREATIEITELK